MANTRRFRLWIEAIKEGRDTNIKIKATRSPKIASNGGVYSQRKKRRLARQKGR